MSTRRILAFTGIRSDYDLLAGVYKELAKSTDIDFRLIVAGAHLSPTFGYTVRDIEADQIPILARIESLLDADSPSARVKSAAILLMSCIDAIAGFAPDLIVYAGDREDAWVGALVANYLKIPSVHFFGGDHASDGNVDNPIRHAVSKLSSAHFVAHPAHSERLMRLGEPSRRIFLVGNPALDRFAETPWLDKNAVVTVAGRPAWTEYVVVIFHPILGFEDSAGREMEAILRALRKLGIRAFVSAPNVDAGNRAVFTAVGKAADDEWIAQYRNLDRITFVNLLRHARALIGNSSAGLLEAPVIPLPVVNVGARQTGRLAGPNVIFTASDEPGLTAAIARAISPEFRASLSPEDSPYRASGATTTAFQLLRTLDFQQLLYKPEDVGE